MSKGTFEYWLNIFFVFEVHYIGRIELEYSFEHFIEIGLVILNIISERFVIINTTLNQIPASQCILSAASDYNKLTE